MGKSRAGLHNHTPAILVLLVATALLYFVNKEKTDRLFVELQTGHQKERAETKREFASWTKQFNDYKEKDNKKKDEKIKKALDEKNIVSRGLQEDNKKEFEKIKTEFRNRFTAVSDSLKATNVEVETVKNVLDNLDDHVSRETRRISSIEYTIADTNGQVKKNEAEIGDRLREMQSGLGGIAEFYKDIKAQTKWAVHGPGGCNDVFPSGEVKHPWQLTRSFVHSERKIELEQCKTLCELKAPWGCKYISFYGAGKGWCYGFQSCRSHTTGQGWGGYTTYALRELKENLGDYVE